MNYLRSYYDRRTHKIQAQLFSSFKKSYWYTFNIFIKYVSDMYMRILTKCGDIANTKSIDGIHIMYMFHVNIKDKTSNQTQSNKIRQ